MTGSHPSALDVTPLRVLFVSPQLTQTPGPYQKLAQDPRFSILVAYLTGDTKEIHSGEEHLNASQLQDVAHTGYPSQLLTNRAIAPSRTTFFGIFNPEIWRLISDFDAIVLYGHNYLTFLIGIVRCLLLRKPFFLSTDSVARISDNSPRLRDRIKQVVLPFLYNRVATGVFVPSSRSKAHLETLGVRAERIFLTPYVVDNDLIAKSAHRSDRALTRKQLSLADDDIASLFVGKFIERKRAIDLVEATARVNNPHHIAVFVGDGPLRALCETRARELGIDSKCRFIGMVPYGDLPSIYSACDLLVHPASHEPWGLIVNEAMVCGLPVILSDGVGAGDDLVSSHGTGFVYPCGDITMLAEKLRLLITDTTWRKSMGARAQLRMASWTPESNAVSVSDALLATNHSDSHPSLEKRTTSG